jgi:glycogen(starch) synthase
MHILITTPGFPPFVGGGERHTGTLARTLIERGQIVTVLTSAALEEADYWEGQGRDVEVASMASGLTVIRMPIRRLPGGYRGLLAWRKGMVILSNMPGTRGTLMRMARRVPSMAKLDVAISAISKPVDVVHGFNISWEYAMLIGYQYARQNGIPFVASPLAHLGTGPKDRVARNSTMRHQKHVLSTADLLLTNTALEADGLKLRSVELPDFRVAGPGVDLPETVAAFPKRAEFQKPFVLFIGRANYDKGAIHAAEAVLRLQEQGSEIQLVLIGSETEEFRGFLESLPASRRQALHALGFVEESLKHAYLREAEALLLPSRTDSFGIVLLESWLHGRPVIAANAGGIPEVVDDGENGVLVPFGDVAALANAIQMLIENQAISQELGRNGYQKLMNQYTWEAVTDVVLEAYRYVVNRDRHAVEIPS